MIGRGNCILSQKNIKLQPVPPTMPLEALLTPDNLTYSAFDGIAEAQVVILYFYYYSRTRLRQPRLGNNKKYVLTEVRLIRGTSYPST